MKPTIGQYKQLETRIKKGGLDALKARWEELLARWEFGRQLLKERGGHKKIPDGRLREIYEGCNPHVTTFDAYRMECSRRMRFAEQYPTKAQVRAAFEDYGSWSEICARGLGEDRRADAATERGEAEIAHLETYRQDPVHTLLPRIGEGIAGLHDLVVDLQQHVRGGLLEVNVGAMVTRAEQLRAEYHTTQMRWRESLGDTRPFGLLALIAGADS